MLDEIRIADQLPEGESTRRKIGWDGGNYFISVLGTPSESKPWMLQIGGHHVAYNLTFNGGREGATPLFFGSEPIIFNMGDTEFEPLATQSAAMSNLARALANHTEAKLSGTFTDVVKGVVVVPVPGSCQRAAPTPGFRTTIRQALQIAAFSTARWRPRSRRWCARPSKATPHYPARPLHAAAGRWRISRPRRSPKPTLGLFGRARVERGQARMCASTGRAIWMELAAASSPFRNPRGCKMRYHALWRDKLSDYGGMFGP